MNLSHNYTRSSEWDACKRTLSLSSPHGGLWHLQKKEKSESERLLMEQLQAKELELLQLKTEMETSQGHKQSPALLPFLYHYT